MNAPTLTSGKAGRCKACSKPYTEPGSRRQKYCNGCMERLLNPRKWAIELRQRVAELEAAWKS